MTDNRTNEPTEEQIEAAAKAIADCHNPGMFEKYPENWRVEARAALEAAESTKTEHDAALTRIAELEAELEVAMRPHSECERSGAEAGERIVDLECDLARAEARMADALEARQVDEAAAPDGQVIIPIARIRELREAKDAALAAVERVRAAIRQYPNYGARFAVEAALDGAPEPDDEPCDAEVHSWDYYRPEQIDSYWIRCTMLGKHDEHEDSHTGLKWRSGLPVEGESK